MLKIYQRILLTLTGVMLAGGIQAQALLADTVFHFNYFDAVNGMIIHSSGECILVGKMETDSLTPKNIWVKRLGFQGDSLVTVVWEKIFYPSNASRVSKVMWTQDSNFVIAGSWNNFSMLLKMSPEGDSLSTLLFPGNANTYFQDVVEMPDSDFVFLQVDQSNDLYGKLMRSSKTGNVDWTSQFYDRYYTSLEYYNEDSVILAGYEYHQEYQHILYGAYNPGDGGMLFNNMFQDYYGTNFTMTADSNAMYLGNQKQYITSSGYVSQVIKVKPDGEVDWDVDFTGIGSPVIRDIDIYDNYLVTCSERSSAGQVIIGAITFDGILAANWVVPKPSPTAVDVETYKNYLYLTGRQVNGTNGKDVFFMKFNIDSLFVISGQEEYLVKKPVRVYPNPATANISLDVDFSRTGTLETVRIYNLTGNLEKEFNPDARHVQQLSVADLPKGLHLMVMYFENHAPVTEKILVVH